MCSVSEKMRGKTKGKKSRMNKRGWERNNNFKNWWLPPSLLSMSQTEGEVRERLMMHLGKIILSMFISKTAVGSMHGHVPERYGQLKGPSRRISARHKFSPLTC